MKRGFFRALATAMVIAMTTLTLSAQPGGGQGGQRGQGGERPSPEDMADRMTERMTEVLDMTEKQSDDFYEIQLKYIEKYGMRQLPEEAQKERNKEIKAVLTPEQAQKYENMMKQMAGQRGPGGQRGQGGQGGQGGQRPQRAE